MTLIKVKERTVLDIPSLFRAVLKSIYELEKMTVQEHDQMIESIESWTNHIKYRREMGFNAIDEENAFALGMIGTLYKQDQEGKFNNRKIMFKEKNIDYRKYHRLPEAYRPVDFHNGQKALEEHMRTNPEEYRK